MPVEHPIVGIAMGSDSDLPTMQDAADLLDELHIAYEIRIISACLLYTSPSPRDRG